MPYVSDLEGQNDLFISYAHADNKVNSWVAKLKKKLGDTTEIELAKEEKNTAIKLKIFLDLQIDKVGPVADQLIPQLKKSAVLLVVMSKMYLLSDWCKKEGKWFKEMEKPQPNLRIFIVEKEETNRDDWPEFLKDKNGGAIYSHIFFQIKNDVSNPLDIMNEKGDLHPDVKYLLPELARNLSGTLIKLKHRPAERSNQDPSTGDILGTIFLALTSSDISYYERDELSGLLSDKDVVVLPQNHALDNRPLDVLPECDLFVQLLSRAPEGTMNIPDSTRGIIFQHNQAISNQVPVIQWLKSDIELETIKHAEYRSFLESCLATAHKDLSIQAFRDSVLSKLKQCQNNSGSEQLNQDRQIFKMAVNWNKSDEKLAEDLEREMVEAFGGQVIPVLPKTNVAWETRRDGYEDCDGMILVWGQSGVKWILKQIENVIPDLWPDRVNKIKVLVNFEKPSAEDKLGFDPDRHYQIKTLDFTDEINVDLLKKYCAKQESVEPNKVDKTQ